MTPYAGTAHLLSVDDLDDQEVTELLDEADRLRRTQPERILDRKVLASLFFQPSTRTRLSFEAAAIRLGAGVTGFADPNVTRAHPASGETYEDVVATASMYADVMVIRSTHERGALRAAAVAGCPVINAGDGDEHPSQALLDLLTIRHLMRDELGRGLSDAHVAIQGCTTNRYCTPLIKLLSRSGVGRVTFLVEPGRPLPDGVAGSAAAGGAQVQVTESLEHVLETCDVLYVGPRDTRFVRDATLVYDDRAPFYPESHVITADKIRRTRSTTFVMHPLPRRNEISTCVDALPNAAYFRQVGLSVPLRMAVYGRSVSSGIGNLPGVAAPWMSLARAPRPMVA